MLLTLQRTGCFNHKIMAYRFCSEIMCVNLTNHWFVEVFRALDLNGVIHRFLSYAVLKKCGCCGKGGYHILFVSLTASV